MTETSISLAFVAALLAVAAAGFYHEINARLRAREYKHHHDEEMLELRAALGLIRAAIYQRTTLESDVAWVLRAIENHAVHLEDMGRVAPMKWPPQKTMPARGAGP